MVVRRVANRITPGLLVSVFNWRGDSR